MNLAEYLETRSISEKEFSKMIGVTPTSVANYLRRGRIPKLKTAKMIEKVTNGKVKIEEWLKDD